MNAEKEQIPEAVAEATVALLAPYSSVRTVVDLKRVIYGEEEVNVDKILSQHEAEDYSRLSYWSLLRAEKAGKIKVAHAGKKRLYRRSAIDQFLFGEEK